MCGRSRPCYFVGSAPRGGCGAPTGPFLTRCLEIANENAQPVARVFINIGKSHREPNPAHRIDHCSLKSDISNGQRNSDVFNDCSFRRCSETAIDITADWAEAADARILLTPRPEPRAIKMPSDPLSRMRAAVASRWKRSSPEPWHLSSWYGLESWAMRVRTTPTGICGR